MTNRVNVVGYDLGLIFYINISPTPVFVYTVFGITFRLNTSPGAGSGTGREALLGREYLEAALSVYQDMKRGGCQ